MSTEGKIKGTFYFKRTLYQTFYEKTNTKEGSFASR